MDPSELVKGNYSYWLNVRSILTKQRTNSLLQGLYKPDLAAFFLFCLLLSAYFAIISLGAHCPDN